MKHFDPERLDPNGAWNPRYVLYARHHGRDPRAQLEYDETEYPGGRMTGFTIWINDQWHRFAALTCKCGRPGSDYCVRWVAATKPAEFDNWLRNNIP